MADWFAWSVIRSSDLSPSCFLMVVTSRSRAQVLARMTSRAARGKTLQRVRGGLFLVQTNPSTRDPDSLSGLSLSLLVLLFRCCTPWLTRDTHAHSLSFGGSSWAHKSLSSVVAESLLAEGCYLLLGRFYVPPLSFLREKRFLDREQVELGRRRKPQIHIPHPRRHTLAPVS